MAQANEHQLPKLPYGYDALEPHISAKIMEIHHSKHHQTYVNNLNAAEKAYATAVSNKDIKSQLATQQAIKFNGGGFINHNLYFFGLAPPKEGGGQFPSDGKLSSAINSQYGSLDGLKKKFNAAALALQGSGWIWLGYSEGKLDIQTTKDQDPLLTHVPILALDMWEHAYYLQRENRKAEYVDAIWNVWNWKEAEKRFNEAASKASL
ncbi:unnamed protein product [Sympodiomycopsis kandeliae]